MGNAFLNDLNQADALIQVVDASGRTDLHGNASEGNDPAEEIVFLEKEISFWIAGIIRKNWGKVRGRDLAALAEVLTGLRISGEICESIAEKLGLAKERLAWEDDEILEFADESRKLTKPIVVAANKIDVPGARKNFEKLRKRFPERIIVPTCAVAELALRKAESKKMINYIPGDNKFEEVPGAVADEKQRIGLSSIRKIISENEFGTGVQKVIDETVFGKLGLIAVYPVEDEHKLTNNFGDVLPDAFLVPKGTTALEFAGKIHTDLAKNFIGAINARTRMRVGKEHVLENGDVIKIVAGGR
jgi:hypothetical protein